MPVPSRVAAACDAAVAFSIRAIRFPSTVIVFPDWSRPLVTSTIVTLSIVIVCAPTCVADASSPAANSVNRIAGLLSLLRWADFAFRLRQQRLGIVGHPGLHHEMHVARVLDIRHR